MYRCEYSTERLVHLQKGIARDLFGFTKNLYHNSMALEESTSVASVVNFGLYVDPDPSSEYGSNLDSDSQHWLHRAKFTELF